MQDKGELKFSEEWEEWFKAKVSAGPTWSNQIYKKQNEMAMEALEESQSPKYQAPHIKKNSFVMYTDKGGWEEISSKKKACKTPPVKPGDDWWIML